LSFVERHGLYPRAEDAAVGLRRIVEEQGLEVIRLSFPDQHGICAARRWSPRGVRCSKGCTITTTMFAKTLHKTVFVFTAGGGFVFRRCRARPTS